MTAAMQEDFEQADDAGLVDLDAGITTRTDGDRQGQALKQREVDMDIEPLCLEIGEIVGDQLVAQKGGELFVLLEEGVLEVGAEDMMAVLDAVDDGGELAVH